METDDVGKGILCSLSVATRGPRANCELLPRTAEQVSHQQETREYTARQIKRKTSTLLLGPRINISMDKILDPCFSETSYCKVFQSIKIILLLRLFFFPPLPLFLPQIPHVVILEGSAFREVDLRGGQPPISIRQSLCGPPGSHDNMNSSAVVHHPAGRSHLAAQVIAQRQQTAQECPDGYMSRSSFVELKPTQKVDVGMLVCRHYLLGYLARGLDGDPLVTGDGEILQFPLLQVTVDSPSLTAVTGTRTYGYLARGLDGDPLVTGDGEILQFPLLQVTVDSKSLTAVTGTRTYGYLARFLDGDPLVTGDGEILQFPLLQVAVDSPSLTALTGTRTYGYLARGLDGDPLVTGDGEILQFPLLQVTVDSPSLTAVTGTRTYGYRARGLDGDPLVTGDGEILQFPLLQVTVDSPSLTAVTGTRTYGYLARGLDGDPLVTGDGEILQFPLLQVTVDSPSLTAVTGTLPIVASDGRQSKSYCGHGHTYLWSLTLKPTQKVDVGMLVCRHYLLGYLARGLDGDPLVTGDGEILQFPLLQVTVDSPSLTAVTGTLPIVASDGRQSKSYCGHGHTYLWSLTLKPTQKVDVGMLVCRHYLLGYLARGLDGDPLVTGDGEILQFPLLQVTVDSPSLTAVTGTRTYGYLARGLDGDPLVTGDGEILQFPLLQVTVDSPSLTASRAHVLMVTDTEAYPESGHGDPLVTGDGEILQFPLLQVTVDSPSLTAVTAHVLMVTDTEAYPESGRRYAGVSSLFVRLSGAGLDGDPLVTGDGEILQFPLLQVTVGHPSLTAVTGTRTYDGDPLVTGDGEILQFPLLQVTVDSQVLLRSRAHVLMVTDTEAYPESGHGDPLVTGDGEILQFPLLQVTVDSPSLTAVTGTLPIVASDGRQSKSYASRAHVLMVTELKPTQKVDVVPIVASDGRQSKSYCGHGHTYLWSLTLKPTQKVDVGMLVCRHYLLGYLARGLDGDPLVTGDGEILQFPLLQVTVDSPSLTAVTAHVLMVTDTEAYPESGRRYAGVSSLFVRLSGAGLDGDLLYWDGEILQFPLLQVTVDSPSLTAVTAHVLMVTDTEAYPESGHGDPLVTGDGEILQFPLLQVTVDSPSLTAMAILLLLVMVKYCSSIVASDVDSPSLTAVRHTYLWLSGAGLDGNSLVTGMVKYCSSHCCSDVDSPSLTRSRHTYLWSLTLSLPRKWTRWRSLLLVMVKYCSSHCASDGRQSKSYCVTGTRTYVTDTEAYQKVDVVCWCVVTIFPLLQVTVDSPSLTAVTAHVLMSLTLKPTQKVDVGMLVCRHYLLGYLARVPIVASEVDSPSLTASRAHVLMVTDTEAYPESGRSMLVVVTIFPIVASDVDSPSLTAVTAHVLMVTDTEAYPESGRRYAGVSSLFVRFWRGSRCDPLLLVMSKSTAVTAHVLMSLNEAYPKVDVDAGVSSLLLVPIVASDVDSPSLTAVTAHVLMVTDTEAYPESDEVPIVQVTVDVQAYCGHGHTYLCHDTEAYPKVDVVCGVSSHCRQSKSYCGHGHTYLWSLTLKPTQKVDVGMLVCRHYLLGYLARGLDGDPLVTGDGEILQFPLLQVTVDSPSLTAVTGTRTYGYLARGLDGDPLVTGDGEILQFPLLQVTVDSPSLTAVTGTRTYGYLARGLDGDPLVTGDGEILQFPLFQVTVDSPSLTAVTGTRTHVTSQTEEPSGHIHFTLCPDKRINHNDKDGQERDERCLASRYIPLRKKIRNICDTSAYLVANNCICKTKSIEFPNLSKINLSTASETDASVIQTMIFNVNTSLKSDLHMGHLDGNGGVTLAGLANPVAITPSIAITPSTDQRSATWMSKQRADIGQHEAVSIVLGGGGTPNSATSPTREVCKRLSGGGRRPIAPFPPPESCASASLVKATTSLTLECMELTEITTAGGGPRQLPAVSGRRGTFPGSVSPDSALYWRADFGFKRKNSSITVDSSYESKTARRALTRSELSPCCTQPAAHWRVLMGRAAQGEKKRVEEAELTQDCVYPVLWINIHEAHKEANSYEVPFATAVAWLHRRQKIRKDVMAMQRCVNPETPSINGATMAERLDCSPHTKSNRVQSPTGKPRIFASGNRVGRCRWSAVFLGDLSFPPPFHSHTAPFSPHFALIGSQDLAKKHRANVSKGKIEVQHPPGIQPCSPRWEAGSLTATPLRLPINPRSLKVDGEANCATARNNGDCERTIPRMEFHLDLSQNKLEGLSYLRESSVVLCRPVTLLSPTARVHSRYVWGTCRPFHVSIPTDPTTTESSVHNEQDIRRVGTTWIASCPAEMSSNNCGSTSYVRKDRSCPDSTTRIHLRIQSRCCSNAAVTFAINENHLNSFGCRVHCVSSNNVTKNLSDRYKSTAQTNGPLFRKAAHQFAASLTSSDLE
ncbi:hypothetical protein PR048_002599 [Dryococelus australis]|uniref:Uncharacterized protein n=1 Tax=Dryococelus australis TaxID=614101 RepID=A0ABQ9IKM4_9NEOP|nr:hypothetical protein PR048_002599 [Dryococelus australis]